METVIFKDSLVGAAELIRQGELVAVPTETVYGLAGNALDEKAVHEIYRVKGRPEVKPLSVMIPGAEAMEDCCDPVPAQAYALARRFWPGPLTIVLKSKPSVPEIVRAGGDTLGLRCPDHPLTLKALRLAGVPFAAPSANPSGAPSPKTAQEVARYFSGEIAGIIDGGACGIGRESTIIDMSAAPYKILRPGALPEEDIADALADHLRIIGITGGTGCGKTTALKELEKRGALIIDCDQVYHRLLDESRELLEEIGRYFPGAVTGGMLDRKALGAVVFSNQEALEDLNIITHKHVHLAVRDLLRDWAMKGGTLAAIDAIELISSGIARRCGVTIGVIAEEETRIRRIMERDSISREYALMRVKAQRPNSYFEQNCDFTVSNDSDREQFIAGFNGLIEEVLTKWTK